MSDKIDKLIVKHTNDAFEAYMKSIVGLSNSLPDENDLRSECLVEMTYNLVLKIMSEFTILKPLEEFVDFNSSFIMTLTSDLFTVYNETHDKKIKIAKKIYEENVEL